MSEEHSNKRHIFPVLEDDDDEATRPPIGALPGAPAGEEDQQQPADHQGVAAARCRSADGAGTFQAESFGTSYRF